VFIYNRDDLARVATGLQPAYGVQPANRGVLPLPTNSTPNGENPWSIAVGAAWDAVDKRVYVWMRGTTVYIFQIG